jgi:hypothetical protein
LNEFRFREGKEKLMITTNLCARGIDIEKVFIITVVLKHRFTAYHQPLVNFCSLIRIIINQICYETSLYCSYGKRNKPNNSLTMVIVEHEEFSVQTMPFMTSCF